MNILVTGGSGFIGSNFIRSTLSTYPDDHIVNLDKLTYAGNQRNLEGISSDTRYEFVRGDINNRALVDLLVGECDAVVHFAAESHVDRSITDPVAFLKTNVMGTQVLLDACVRHKKRFHHISTDEVFGSLPLNDPNDYNIEAFDEYWPYDPSSPYSASKAASDHLVRAYHRTYGLRATITNCSNNYGPYQHPEKLIPRMIINALLGKKLPVYGNGENVRDWIHVDDHCFAINRVLRYGNPGETFCIGGNAERSNLEVVKEILHILGKGEDLIEFVPDRPGHDLRYAIDSGKFERAFGWNRRYTFSSGLHDTVNWYRDNRSWWAELLDYKHVVRHR